MSALTLPRVWSLDVSPHANAAPFMALLSTPGPAPPGFNVWFVNNIFITRWSIHYIAALLTIVPSSETRLRDEGIATMYKAIRGIAGILSVVAQTRGITVPSLPDIPEDWREEAAIDYKTLHAALFPHMGPLIKKSIEFTTELITSKDKYHWASLVAMLSVSSGMYLDTMTTESSTGVLADQTLAPYTEAMTGHDLAQATKVLREEMMKIRSEEGETGWREEEAKNLSTEHLRQMKDFFAIGSD